MKDKSYVIRDLKWLLLVFVLHSVALTGQTLDLQEKKLSAQYAEILAADRFSREKPAREFLDSLAIVLQQAEAFEYPFAELKNIGNIYSDDEQLRVFTWNIPAGLDEQLYYGIVLFKEKKNDLHKLAKLNDPLGVNQVRKVSKWPGALYYEVIQTRHAGQDYYTLLGFDLHNALSNKKLIDVLSIDAYGELYFCEKLIEYEGQKVDRLAFEYNEKAVMSLRYDDTRKMIIFDHLSPSKPSLKGQYEFYGPDFTYDGLKFEKGIWTHYPQIDITN